MMIWIWKNLVSKYTFVYSILFVLCLSGSSELHSASKVNTGILQEPCDQPAPEEPLHCHVGGTEPHTVHEQGSCLC